MDSLDVLKAKAIIKETRKLMLPEGEIRAKTRKREVVIARQVAMYLIRNNTRISLHGIARLFCHDSREKVLNHATIYHAINTVGELIETNYYWHQEPLKWYAEEVLRRTKIKLNYYPIKVRRVSYNYE